MSHIVALSGGVGGAKLVHGLSLILEPEELTVIVNTGDDFDHFGLRICPDIDSVLYALADRENREVGWGRRDETWQVLDEMRALGDEAWFKLGDKDLALHLIRLGLLRHGKSLTAVTRELALRLGVSQAILPMSDAAVSTTVLTADGDLAFQDYFVRHRCEPQVLGFRFEGIERAEPSAELVRALTDPGLDGIVFCPSNPYVSLGPILAVAGIRSLLEERSKPIVAVSPIVGGKALKGPAGKMMLERGETVSALSVARMYGGLVDAMILDESDSELLRQRLPSDPQLYTAQTVMRAVDDRKALAADCLRVLANL